VSIQDEKQIRGAGRRLGNLTSEEHPGPEESSGPAAPNSEKGSDTCLFTRGPVPSDSESQPRIMSREVCSCTVLTVG